MFRRLKSSFTGGSKGSTKVLFTVRIASLTGLNPGASCRVVWARQAKVQVTSPAIAAHNGSAQWPGEDLSLVSTMEADGKGSYAPKEFVFKVQQEERGGKFVTLGKLSLDLSPCVGAGSGKPMGRDVRVPLGARPGAARGVATMSLVVSAEVVRKGGGSDSEGEEGEDDLASEGSDISSVHEFPTPRPSSPMRATPPQPLAAVTLALPPERKAAAVGVGTAALLGGLSGAATTGASAGEETSATVENSVNSANHVKEEKPRGLDSQATGVEHSSTGAPPSPPSSSAEARQLRADLLAVQEELSAARAAAAEAEARAARAESDAGQAAGRAEASAAQAAKQEARIAQLLAAVEARGEGKSELEERLLAAETELGEAEALANEAMSLLESAQNEASELREALEGARHDAAFATEQASRERSGWEARLKEAFRRVEGAVALAERAAEERDDLAARLEAAERRAAELERAAAGAAGAAAGAAALAGAAVAAEPAGASAAALQAELESAHLRLKAMEEAVERADAERAEAKAALQRERSAAPAPAPEQDGLHPATSPTAAADEAVDALRLELQFAQQESARLRGELETAARELQATVDMHGEEARALRARCAELGAQLHEARGALAQAKGLVAEHEARVRVLEAAGVAAAVAVAASPPQASAAPLASPLAAAAGRSSPRQQQAPPSPPAQPAVLDVLNGELTSLSAAMVGLTTERDALESRLRDVETEFAAQQAALQLAQQRLESREARLAALERASASGAAAPASATTSEDDEVAAARNLAAFSSAELASAVTSLAEAQAERADLAAKLAELRGEVSTLRRSNEGELRSRLEALERDLLVARNRADVNELFREEHDRLASDLVQTKLVWAEGQETLVKLRRQLVKSQEKSMSFASKLTRLETKLYARVKSTMKDLKQKATPRDRHA